jgi:hypothetical protein
MACDCMKCKAKRYDKLADLLRHTTLSMTGPDLILSCGDLTIRDSLFDAIEGIAYGPELQLDDAG